MDTAQRRRLSLCLARLAQGERAAATEVFELAWPVVRAFCARLSGAGDADDLAQQALVKVFEQAVQFDPARDGLAWVLEVAAWESRTARKRRARSREAGGSAESLGAPDAAALPDQALQQRELAAALDVVLAQLSPAEREAVRGEVTAGERGVSGAAWRKRRERALSRLKLLWRTNHGLE